MRKSLNLSPEEKAKRIKEQKLRSYHKNKAKHSIRLKGTDENSLEQRRRSYHKNKHKHKSYYYDKPIIDVIFDSCKQRTKKSSLPFDLDKQFLYELYDLQGGKCAVTGINFELDKNSNFRKRPFAPSLDRIDSNQGYVKSNVRFVCTIVNIALNEFGDIIFDRMCKAYVENIVRS